ncbi:MAG: MarR family transcriptional regulator [Magnetovibrio sp.]|nr:MarR family transcriptional regulator [Magnetovibrio sp.]
MSKLIPDFVPPQPSPEFSAMVKEKREAAATYLIAYAQKLSHRALGERLKAHGVTVAQWAVLVVLWENDGLSQKELSERVAVETPTLSRTLDRMERVGLVLRDRNEKDRRIVHVRLTQYGSSLWRDLVPEAEANLAQALNGFNEQEETQLCGFLKRIISNMCEEKKV